MTAKTYNLLVRLLAVALALLIAAGIIIEAPIYVPAAGIMMALLLANIMRRSVKEVMVDERVRRIDEMAVSISFRIGSVVTAAFVLVALSLKNSLPAWMEGSATTLAYWLCGLLLVHQLFTRYYGKRL